MYTSWIGQERAWLLILTLTLVLGQFGCNSSGGDRLVVVPTGAASDTPTLSKPAASPQAQTTGPAIENTAAVQNTITVGDAATPLVISTQPPSATLLPACSPGAGYAWAFTYGGRDFNQVASILPASDGSVLFVGDGRSFIEGANAVWAVKFNPAGTPAWQKAYSATAGDYVSAAEVVIPGRVAISNDRVTFAISEQDGSVAWKKSVQGAGIAMDTPDGGFLLAGSGQMAKFDSQGQPVWQLAIEGDYWIAPTLKGEFILARVITYAETTSIYRPIYTDIEVLKVSAEGRQAWKKTYGKTLGDDEALNTMIVTRDGGALLAGTHWGASDSDSADIWVLKLSAGGSLSWQTTLSGKWGDNVLRIAQLPNGEYALAGNTYNEAGEAQLLAAKFKANGALAWQKILPDLGSIDVLSGLQDGSMLLGLSGAWLVRLDRSGNLAWDKAYESVDYFTALEPYGDDLLVGGRSGGRALMILLHNAGTPSGAFQVKDSALKISTTMVNRPNRTLGYPPGINDMHPVALQINTPGIEAVDFDLIPEPFCLTENGEEPRPMPTPSQTPTITPIPSPTATPLAFTRSLSLASPAMRGEDVYAVQVRLLALGYTEVGTPDGIFGKLTDQAVRRFQKRNGLEVDGVVGPLTWKCLFSADQNILQKQDIQQVEPPETQQVPGHHLHVTFRLQLSRLVGVPTPRRVVPSYYRIRCFSQILYVS